MKYLNPLYWIKRFARKITPHTTATKPRPSNDKMVWDKNSCYGFVMDDSPQLIQCGIPLDKQIQRLAPKEYRQN